MRRWIVSVAAAGLAIAGVAFASPAQANHAWSTYHWARTTPSFSLQLGDNVSGPWDSVLATTSNDWTKSTVLDTTIVGGTTSAKTCKPRAGRVEVCNAKYGRNGWLGIAQIWASGSHITQGVVKLNDTYFSTAQYNTPAWRDLVSCQEVGHTFGLGHVNENFNDPNTGSCMDYTNDPSRNDGSGTNEHPNQHDFDQLASIYAHLDSTTTVAGAATAPQGAGNSQADWGRAVSKGGPHGHADEFEKDLGDGTKVITHVFWADHDHDHEH
jgi:hypothetical protein